MGHIKRACKTKIGQKEKTIQGKGGWSKFGKRANFIKGEGDDSETAEILTLYHMKASNMTCRA